MSYVSDEELAVLTTIREVFLEYIAKNLDPDDVFNENDLRDWALKNMSEKDFE